MMTRAVLDEIEDALRRETGKEIDIVADVLHLTVNLYVRGGGGVSRLDMAPASLSRFELVRRFREKIEWAASCSEGSS